MLKTAREGVKKNCEPILIYFQGGNVPKNVFLVFLSYLPKPLRCCNCRPTTVSSSGECGGDDEYTEGVEEECNQNAATVEEPILWHTVWWM